MNEPPDRPKTTQVNQLCFSLDQTKKLKTQNNGPKYLVMSRLEPNESMEKVSPFLIQKVIDNVCGGPVDEFKRLRNGTALIKTKNLTQATKLIKLINLDGKTQINITEHNTLNSSKGVIYCNYLREIPESEITSELTSQNVSECKKILKKENNQLRETGLIILTFATPNLPTEINIGYEKVPVRPYIPLPIRCKNCGRLGHPTKFCKSKSLCLNCSNPTHIQENSPETCTNINCCINCKEDNRTNYYHNIFDRNCPTFLKHKELQAIKITEKTDIKTAIKLFNERHQLRQATYSSVSYPANSASTSASASVKRKTENEDRKIISYEDIDKCVPSTSSANAKQTNKPPQTVEKPVNLSTQILSETKMKIFHRNNPNLKSPFKTKNSKHQKNHNSKPRPNAEADSTSDDEPMNIT